MVSERYDRPISDEKVKVQEYYLRGFLNGGREPLALSQAALELAVSAYGSSRRDDGALAISHPLSMACTAISMGVRDDATIATILLHDVCEDYNYRVQDVSESSAVRNGVRYMTITHRKRETLKCEVKTRYFEEILESREATITKGFDRIHNFESSIGVFNRDRALKLWRETYYLLMPALREAKHKWPAYSDLFHAIRERLRTNLKWSLYNYGFTDEEINANYGTLSFENTVLKKEPTPPSSQEG